MLASAFALSAPRIGVVVPALDEEEALRRNLPAALAWADDLVVSDGGSRDRSREVAAALGARVVVGPAGRGGQLNRGAAAVGGEVLAVLHADTRAPAGAAAAIRRAVAAGAVGGAFTLAFEPAPPLLRLGARAINLRTRWLGVALGDQIQFATREAFDRLDGYREWQLLEDLDFIRRLRRLGPVATLSGPAVTDSRRFLAQGPLRTVARNWLIWGLFACGVPADRLARLYRHIR
jgi:rSAM/selenodomain-associated transferase 2